MNKFKIVIFISITLVTLIVIVSPYLNYNSPKLVENKIFSKGEYIIGEDLAPGHYDVSAIKGNSEFIGRKLSAGDKLINMNYRNQEHLIVKGTGEVKLSPAKIKPLELNSKNNYLIKHSGNYSVGEHLNSGRYKLSYEVKNNKKNDEKSFIQILSKSDNEVLDSFSFLEKNEYIITLKESNVLNVNKTLIEENDNIIIKLKKL